MARPSTKQDLLDQAKSGFTALFELIDTMPPQWKEATFLFEDRDRNIRDVLAHLHEWHNMMALWYQGGVVERSLPAVPKLGYTWRTIPALNIEIWKQAQAYSLEDITLRLQGSHQKMVNLIEKHTNDELFATGIYPFTKSTTLGAYLISATSSHYTWAIKKIKKHIRTQKQAAS